MKNPLFIIGNALINMVINANEHIVSINRSYNEDYFNNSNDFIINFNYTSTIEELFIYSRDIFHIHGFLQKDDNLIFGFKNEDDNFKKYLDKTNVYYLVHYLFYNYKVY